jgi:hypothetical protein
MKTFVRIGAMVTFLSLAALFAGCSSYSSYANRRQPARDFEVVETSTKRQFTGTEMEYLRAKVREYLVQQGQTGSGEYYVKVYLGEEFGVGKGEWLIVRYSNYPSTVYSVASSSPIYSYPSYRYSYYDYYPFGFFGLESMSFRYYDYPYYYGNAGYYWPYYGPTWTSGRGHDRDRWRDRRDRDDKDRDGDRPRVGTGRPSGALKPSFVPANVGRTPWTGSSGNSIGDNRRWDNNRTNRPGDNNGVRRWSERPERRSPNKGPAYTPPSPPSSYSTGAPAYQPSTRSNLHRERTDSGSSRSSGRDAGTRRVHPSPSDRSYSPPERSYSPPARSEPSSPPRYESPRHESTSSSPGRSESGGYSKDRTDRDTGGHRLGLEP